MSLKAKLEAVIYAAEEPVTLAQLSALFAADALEWKAEQQALKAEQEAASAGEIPEATAEPRLAVAETLPLLAVGFEIPEVDVSATTADAEPARESAGVDSMVPVEPGAAVEAGAVENADDDDADAETPVNTELEARRIARVRDREARAIIRTILDDLIADYTADARGVEIREIAGGFRMATKPECHDAVRSFVKSLKPALKLSLPALETLAVIAYKQPVTAPEVNEIRGVDSSGVFGSLLARKLIATAGRKPVIGRPILYKTTREFLLRFGLKDVTELPSMEEFEKMASLELDEPETAPIVEAPPATNLDLNLEMDETVEEELPSEVLIFTPQSPEPNQTAETAGSNEPTTTGEAAPAAPPATEQAETENFPHGEEVHQVH
jgi:segregation and condensation protein B